MQYVICSICVPIAAVATIHRQNGQHGIGSNPDTMKKTVISADSTNNKPGRVNLRITIRACFQLAYDTIIARLQYLLLVIKGTFPNDTFVHSSMVIRNPVVLGDPCR